MFKNNNEWLFIAYIWVVTGTLSAIYGNYTGVTGSIFAAFMCLMYRDALNKLDKHKNT